MQPTPNIFGRLFYISVHLLSNRRQSILPAKIEPQLFLNVNSTYFLIEDVHDIVTQLQASDDNVTIEVYESFNDLPNKSDHDD